MKLEDIPVHLQDAFESWFDFTQHQKESDFAEPETEEEHEANECEDMYECFRRVGEGDLAETYQRFLNEEPEHLTGVSSAVWI